MSTPDRTPWQFTAGAVLVSGGILAVPLLAVLNLSVPVLATLLTVLAGLVLMLCTPVVPR